MEKYGLATTSNEKSGLTSHRYSLRLHFLQRLVNLSILSLCWITSLDKPWFKTYSVHWNKDNRCESNLVCLGNVSLCTSPHDKGLPSCTSGKDRNPHAVSCSLSTQGRHDRYQLLTFGLSAGCLTLSVTCRDTSRDTSTAHYHLHLHSLIL